MKNSRLESLIKTARKACRPPEVSAPEQAPFGFAARVVARSREIPGERSAADLLERLSWWSAGVSAAICLLAFAHGRSLPEPTAFDIFLEADAGDDASLFEP